MNCNLTDGIGWRDERLTQSRDETDTEAGKESTGEEKRDRSGSGLEDDAEIEDPGRDHERRAATDMISHEGTAEGTKERSCGKN